MAENTNYYQVLDLAGVQQLWNTCKATFVRTVNGNGIDANGNVQINVAGDFQVNGSSVVVNGVANINTESAYNASTNKIATKNDALSTYYKLGKYDSYVDNGDGTTTITRQTGYANIGDLPFNQESQPFLPTAFFTLNGIDTNTQFVSNSDLSISITSANQIMITFPSSCTTNNLVRQYLAEHPTLIQYKLSSSRTEVVISNTYSEETNMVLLWENSTPNVTFGVQEGVSVPNLLNYNYLIVFVKINTTASYGLQVFKVKCEDGKRYFFSLQSGGVTFDRDIEVYGNAINFSNGYRSGYVNNDCLIPVKIYGTNIL